MNRHRVGSNGRRTRVFTDGSSSSEEEDALVADLRRNHALPPLPENIVRRIRSGKFVPFDQLVPHSTYVDSSDGVELFAHPQPNGLVFTPKSKNKAKVVDFFSWSVAWSVFALYHAVFFAGTAIQLMGYHNRAAELASQYSWENFQTYDSQFRQKMANDRKVGALRWDRIDEDLRARHLRNARVFCSSCMNFGHVASRCPAVKSPFPSISK